MNNILITICARGGSKGVKDKNIRDLCGKPLIFYSIEIAREWNRTTDIYISTDSQVIAEVSMSFGIKVIRLRDSMLATDEAGKIPVIADAIQFAEKDNNKKYDYIVDLGVPAPIRKKEDLEFAFNQLVKNDYDVVASACEAKSNPYFTLVELNDSGRAILSKQLNKNVLSRQMAPKVYELNGNINVYRRSFFSKGEMHCVGLNTGIYIMPRERSVDIDTEEDFNYAEMLMKKGIKLSNV